MIEDSFSITWEPATTNAAAGFMRDDPTTEVLRQPTATILKHQREKAFPMLDGYSVYAFKDGAKRDMLVDASKIVPWLMQQGFHFQDVEGREVSPLTFSPTETDYLARCVDLGRSDPQASSILAPDERDTLLRKLGGRRA